jgi:acyl-CoA dehydrogenase
MNFEFSQDQILLQEEIRRQISGACPLERVMKVMDGDTTERLKIWREFAELGYQATAMPEDLGGYGLGYLELCLLAQELGRHVVPVPMISSIYLASEALLLHGSEAQKDKYLPLIASGERVASLAWSEPGRRVANGNIATRFADGMLTGEKLPVADADIADLFVVLAQSEGQSRFCLVDGSDSTLVAQPLAVIDEAWPHARLQMSGTPAELLPVNEVDVDEVFYRAAVLVAFEQIGGAQACLRSAIDYAQERVVFGRSVASFQAIKHKLADVYAATELALSHAYYASWALQQNDKSLRRAAAGARIAATRAYELASAELIQVHGGMGYTWESHCHLFYKRSRMLALALDSEPTWQRRLVEQLCMQEEKAA